MALLRRVVGHRYGDPALTALVDKLAPDAVDEAVEVALDADHDAFRAWVAARVA